MASVEFQGGSKAITSDTGYVTLKWRGADNHSVELQQSQDPQFQNAQTQTIYQGANPSYFVSGLKDGVYYFRLRTMEGQDAQIWSAPLELRVAHHGALKTWGLFALGAVVLLGIFFVIIKGAADEQ